MGGPGAGADGAAVVFLAAEVQLSLRPVASAAGVHLGGPPSALVEVSPCVGPVMPDSCEEGAGRSPEATCGICWPCSDR